MLPYRDHHPLPWADGLAGTMTYRSFHAAAMWTFGGRGTNYAAFGTESRRKGASLPAGPGKNAFHRRWAMTGEPRRQPT